MEYIEALQHMSMGEFYPSQYRWYTIDNLMYFVFPDLTNDIAGIMSRLFKDADCFKLYNTVCIDLNKQVIEGAKKQLVQGTKRKAYKERMKEIEGFTLEDENDDLSNKDMNNIHDKIYKI